MSVASDLGTAWDPWAWVVLRRRAPAQRVHALPLDQFHPVACRPVERERAVTKAMAESTIKPLNLGTVTK